MHPKTGRTLSNPDSHVKGTTKNITQDERLVVLQKRVDELEKVHRESKRAYQADLDRLKAELARAQKLNGDFTERLEKSKKQNDLLDGKLQELRKSSLSDQAEIKDLRVKLKLSEHERAQLAEKQEKGVSNEKKKREAAEAQWQALKTKGDNEIKAARATAQSLETRVKEAQEEAKKAIVAATDARETLEAREAQVLEDLERHKELLCRVTKEYGRLASSSVALTEHTRLKHEHAALQIQTLRLKRKLANAEDQVVELAHLIRSVQADNSFLSKDVAQLENDVRRLFIRPMETLADPIHSCEMDRLYLAIAQELPSDTNDEISKTGYLLSEFYKLGATRIKSAYFDTEADLGEAYAFSNLLQTNLSASRSDNASLRLQIDANHDQMTSLQQRLTQTQSELSETQQTAENLNTELDDQVAALQKEKDGARRLRDQLKQARAQEQVLQAEIEQLTSDLTEAERYQEAYANLYDEVSELAMRNKLAESEAARLSKFNAEIIGHANPAQKIAYLDRIRQELAETKHQLLMVTHAQEALQVENEGLQHELDLYKSVTAHPKEKVRTNLIRVTRQPLTDLNETTTEEIMP